MYSSSPWQSCEFFKDNQKDVSSIQNFWGEKKTNTIPGMQFLDPRFMVHDSLDFLLHRSSYKITPDKLWESYVHKNSNCYNLTVWIMNMNMNNYTKYISNCYHRKEQELFFNSEIIFNFTLNDSADFQHT